jgi:glutamine amidotransferase-like uncharacterized protein
MGKVIWKFLLNVSIVVLFCVPNIALAFSFTGENEQYGSYSARLVKVIRVAVYDSIFRSPKLIYAALSYNWDYSNCSYLFNVTLISSKEILGYGNNSLNTDKFDVFVMGASARQFIHGVYPHFKSNLRRFVYNGGGYVGICGGANEASQKIVDDNTIRGRIINKALLGIVNVYSNDQQKEEWQYAWLEAKGDAGNVSGIPLNISINITHPIFSSYDESIRNIRWWGGPGMFLAEKDDHLMGKVVPLAVYVEEPMKKGPIHHWKNSLCREPVPYKTVRTDILGQYAGVASTYNNKGKIVLFGPHPEYSTWTNGHVNEFKTEGRGWVGNKFVYNWNGQETNYDYNWWIIRRSVAWAAGLPEKALPPINESC